MTSFSMAMPAKPSGEFEQIADHMKGSIWGDAAVEAAAGSDRGLIQVVATSIESLLKDLLLADPGSPDPTVSALIWPGGALCHRDSLLDHLDRYGFLGDREAAAARALFNCVDDGFSWDDKGSLDPEQLEKLGPLLQYFQDSDLAEVRQAGRPALYWGWWELTSSLLSQIEARERGLA